MKTKAATTGSKRSVAFRDDALNGDGKAEAWGVQKAGGVVYECMFVAATARRLAKLNDLMPDSNWHQHKAALQRDA